jgi:hypothetical protein
MLKPFVLSRHQAFLFTVLEISHRASDDGWDNKSAVFRAEYLSGPREDTEWRKEVMDYLNKHGSEPFGQDLLENHPKLRHVRVLRCYHTCRNLDTALAMCTTGFASLAARDEGYFSRGFYLSPDLGYSAEHYHDKESGTATVVCCDVVVGIARRAGLF